MDPEFEQKMMRYLKATQTSPPCEHAGIECRKIHENCIVQEAWNTWRQKPKTLPDAEHPLVFSLWSAGLDRHKAQALASWTGYGMSQAPKLVDAYCQLQRSLTLSPGSPVCDQCQPSTNTWAYCGPYGIDSCRRIPVGVASFSRQLTRDDQVLCIGRRGALKYCSSQSFMAVSHVWAHGWQGTSETGICSRLVDVLLDIATRFFGVEWIWIDVAMISEEKVARTLAINSMDLVYSTAKATLVCDRLLINLDDCSGQELALAIDAADWMTRVWTMQEAMLSKRLCILTRSRIVELAPETSKLVYDTDPTGLWKTFGALQLFANLAHDPRPSLDTVVALSYERLTKAPEDMAKALFPLFGLKWPGPHTTLAQGQIILLKHLGAEASRLVSLHGATGMPSPWGWAPLAIPGSTNSLTSLGRFVTTDGLRGMWGWKEVKTVDFIENPGMQDTNTSNPLLTPISAFIPGFIQSFNKTRLYREQTVPGSASLSDFCQDVHRAFVITATARWSPDNTFTTRLCHLTDMTTGFARLRNTDNGEMFKATITFSKSNPWPWSGKRLILLSSADLSNQRRDSALTYWENIQYFTIASIESILDGKYQMRRLGSVMTGGITIKGESEAISGTLH
ncbi:hypothetical protein K461DRAFT_268178 [Myriangium duriaei CBS 260.36]|uniref:Heterokaryon incompatibility domain-containing protein n=1 Tax=Myriangium duriaei CBS 260.36 TaxID=1168546 RepID=A0A9P4J157_9PEZI|nr:hypothetical protein K461DRAFT_268178 [Myriangium duriaei CBS 260.36]